jgi:nucleotide-binding universal stress UspA family protein
MLVPLDGSSLAECVLPHVVAMAAPLGTEVTLLRVCEPEGAAGAVQPVNAVAWRLKTAEAEAYLEGVAARLRDVGLTVHTRRLEGRAAEQIMVCAAREGSDLILLSSHGQSGLTGWNVSSVVQKLIARARVSIMIVRAYQTCADLTELSLSRIMCPLDGSQRAENILPVAAAVARAHSAEVLLTHFVTRPEMPRRRPHTEEELELMDRVLELNRSEAEARLAEVRDGLRAENVEATSRVVLSDDPAQSLHDWVVQQDVDLVLMSAHGQTGSTHRPYGGLVLSAIVYGSTPLLIAQDLGPEQIELSPAEAMARESVGR